MAGPHRSRRTRQCPDGSVPTRIADARWGSRHAATGFASISCHRRAHCLSSDDRHARRYRARRGARTRGSLAGCCRSTARSRAAAQGAPARPRASAQRWDGSTSRFPDGMAMVWNLGRESGMWEAYLRTDYGLLTKGNAGTNAKNLDAFDALVFVNTTGEMPLDDTRNATCSRSSMTMGKGSSGVHAALDANYKWPEYGEMLGGWFDEHPWMTFDAPIVREDGEFPATRHFPSAFMKHDEIYQAKSWSRDKVQRAAAAGRVEARLREQPARAPGGPGLRRGVVEDVRQGPGVLFHARPHAGELQRSRREDDVLRGDQVGAGHDGGQHDAAREGGG